MGGRATSLQAENRSNSSSPENTSPIARLGNASPDHQQSAPASKSKRQHPVTLSDSEKEIIKQTWRHLQKPPSSPPKKSGNGVVAGNNSTHRGDENLDRAVEYRQLDEMGVLVFMRIFEIAPETRDAFPQFKRLVDRADLLGNVMFRCHARRFVRAVQSVVDNIDSLDIVARPNLERLGRKHREFTGFRPSYLQAFETAMDEIWRDQLGRRRYGPSTRRAWKKVFELITSTVLDGYIEDDDDEVAATNGKCCRALAETKSVTTPAELIEGIETSGNGCVSAEHTSSQASSMCLLPTVVST